MRARRMIDLVYRLWYERVVGKLFLGCHYEDGGDGACVIVLTKMGMIKERY